MAQEKVYLELPPFTGRNVPIIEIAKAMHNLPVRIRDQAG